MFAGHVGAALAIGRVERRVNVGVFVAAALLLDVVLWIFVLLGVESVDIPANFAATHQPQYRFPYSHGLLASLAWSVIAGVAAFTSLGRLQRVGLRVAVLVGVAVFSHWPLDALVHAPELPLVGAGSSKVGFGLWANMPVALVTEAVIVLVGLWLFVRGSCLSRAQSTSLIVLCVLVMGLTAVGMTVVPAPPSARAMAASSLVTLLFVCALVYWIARLPSGERT
jgi:hypothetical protein